MLTRILYYLFSILFLLAATAFAGRLIYPDRSEELSWEVRRAWHEFWYGKEIHFIGLSMLQTEDLEVKLPMDASVLWWNVSRSQIQSRIQGNPLVSEVYVQHCEHFSFRCFEIVIIERKPHFILTLGSRQWAVGEDGGFIAPTPENATLPNTIRIEGLGDPGTSPDMVKSKLELLKKAIKSIQGQSGSPISSIVIEPNLEFVVLFTDLPFSARFDLTNNGEFVQKEAARLKKLIKEFDGRLDVIKSVDLAYNKMAVVQVNQDSVSGSGVAGH